MGRRLLVIGGNAAGLSAASRARAVDPELEITVLERSHFISYGACGIPYYVSGMVPGVESLLTHSPEFFERERRIRVLTRREVTAIRSGQRTVDILDVDSRRHTSLPYDALVIATGAAPVIPDLAGGNLPGVYTVRDLESAIALRAFLEARKPSTGVVIGSGYIGLEMAEALAQRGIAVTVLERHAHLFPALDPDLAAQVQAAMESRGIAAHTGVTAQGMEAGADGLVQSVVTTTGHLPAEVVILAVGVGAEHQLAKDTGITLGASGAIAVDERAETSQPGVYAAGDCAEAYHCILGRPVHIPLGPTANRQGRVAGANAAGRRELFGGVVGTLVVKVFDLEIGRTGLSESEAAAGGFLPAAATITGRTRGGYYPGGGPLTVRLVGDQRTGRLLGATLLGPEGAGLRLNTLAAVLQAAGSPQDVENIDFAYTPPVAPVADPLLIAARALAKKISRTAH